VRVVILYFMEVMLTRDVHKSTSFKEADEWTKRQYRAMSCNERIQAARLVQRRVFGANLPDVSEAGLKKSK
jgi:hypothetical protein